MGAHDHDHGTVTITLPGRSWCGARGRLKGRWSNGGSSRAGAGKFGPAPGQALGLALGQAPEPASGLDLDNAAFFFRSFSCDVQFSSSSWAVCAPDVRPVVSSTGPNSKLLVVRICPYG